MPHWSVDEKQFKKKDPKSYKLWRWVYLINERGLKPGERIDKRQLKKVWPKIKDQIDPEYRRMLEFFLWKKLSSLPANLTFFGRLPKKKN